MTIKKQTNEGLAEFAAEADQDHEVQMAKAELYKIADYAIKLHQLLQSVSERQGIEGWQQAKITKAADYIGSVYHALSYDQKTMPQAGVVNKSINASMSESEKTEYKAILEKAKSKAQQKFMGMVHAAQKGEKPASKEVAKTAKSMPKKAAKDYASTKHKGLPKKKTNETLDLTARKMLGEGTEYELYLLLSEAPAGNVVNKIKIGLAKMPKQAAAKATSLIKKTPKSAWPIAAGVVLAMAGADPAAAGDLSTLADGLEKLEQLARELGPTAGERAANAANAAQGGADAAQGAVEITRDQLKQLRGELGGGDGPTLTNLIQNGVDIDKVKNILTKFGITDSIDIGMALQQIQGTDLKPMVDWVAANR